MKRPSIRRKPAPRNAKPCRCYLCRIQLAAGEGWVVRPDGVAVVACGGCAGIQRHPAQALRVSLTVEQGSWYLVLIPCGQVSQEERAVLERARALVNAVHSGGVSGAYRLHRADFGRRWVAALEEGGLQVVVDPVAEAMLRASAEGGHDVG